MKVLVTGANGFLGTWLVDRLVKEGQEVSVLVRNPKTRESYEKRGIKVFLGDVTQLESLGPALQGQQQVYHLAGLVSYSRDDRETLFKINVGGTENILLKSVLHKVQRILVSSSVVAVGASFDREVLNEGSPYTLSPYHLSYYESKREMESVFIKYVSEGKIDGVMVNPSTVYGAGDASKSSRSTQVKVARGELKFYPPGGVSVAAVEDVVDGMIKAMVNGRSGERYILAGENLTLKQVFDLIADCANVPRPKFSLPEIVFRGLSQLDLGLHYLGLRGPIPSERAIAAILYHWYDSSKARKELGYTTRPAKEAIGQSVMWMKENGFLK